MTGPFFHSSAPTASEALPFALAFALPTTHPWAKPSCGGYDQIHSSTIEHGIWHQEAGKLIWYASLGVCEQNLGFIMVQYGPVSFSAKPAPIPSRTGSKTPPRRTGECSANADPSRPGWSRKTCGPGRVRHKDLPSNKEIYELCVVYCGVPSILTIGLTMYQYISRKTRRNIFCDVLCLHFWE